MNIKLNVSLEHLEELVKKGYSLDIVFLLMCIEQEIDVFAVENVKIKGIIKMLEVKGLISGNKLTIQGKELITFVSTKQSGKLIKKKIPNEDFDAFWIAFPGTDTFEHKSKRFVGSRSLRTNKNECRLLFNKILNEGEYTATQLIEALKYDVFQKKEQSIKQGTNKLTFMQNSATYLRQRSWEPFIELIKDNKQETIKQDFDGVNI